MSFIESIGFGREAILAAQAAVTPKREKDIPLNSTMILRR